MPSISEIKQEMKKTAERTNISKDSAVKMSEYYTNFILNKLKDGEEKAKTSGVKTLGLTPGLSISKITKVLRDNTDFSVSSRFVDDINDELTERFRIITKRAEALAIDNGRKTIYIEDITQAIDEIGSMGKYQMTDDIKPTDIEKIIHRELGMVSDEAIEHISFHLSEHLRSMLGGILRLSKERGRGKGGVTLEDVMDGTDGIRGYNPRDQEIGSTGGED